jgi:hypothetical protein
MASLRNHDPYSSSSNETQRSFYSAVYRREGLRIVRTVLPGSSGRGAK